MQPLSAPSSSNPIRQRSESNGHRPSSMSASCASSSSTLTTPSRLSTKKRHTKKKEKPTSNTPPLSRVRRHPTKPLTLENILSMEDDSAYKFNAAVYEQVQKWLQLPLQTRENLGVDYWAAIRKLGLDVKEECLVAAHLHFGISKASRTKSARIYQLFLALSASSSQSATPPS